MPVVSAPSQVYQTSSTGLVDNFARGLKSLFTPPHGQPAESWIEISPYGFVSRNYINYIAGRLNNCSVSTLPDGSTVVKFADGTMFVQSVSGHLVELDKRRRVILVRVKKSEAEAARLTFGREELSECFKATSNRYGRSLVLMPGNIMIVEAQERVTVTLPNGTEIFARKIAV